MMRKLVALALAACAVTACGGGTKTHWDQSCYKDEIEPMAVDAVHAATGLDITAYRTRVSHVSCYASGRADATVWFGENHKFTVDFERKDGVLHSTDVTEESH